MHFFCGIEIVYDLEAVEWVTTLAKTSLIYAIKHLKFNVFDKFGEKRRMKRFVLLLFMGFTQLALAQDPYLQGDPSKKIRQQAKDLVRAYQPELVMDATQALLFEKKVIEFLMREEKIRQLNIPETEKLHLLKLLREQETAEMIDILTRPQLRHYERIKPRIQPIE